jgi:5'-phosphate synthase pdxT subunit
MAAYWRAQGADVFEIRQLADLERGFDLLALPGGESTVQGKLLKDLGLFDPLKERIGNGLPVFATCAGLILLAEKIDDPTGRNATRPETWFGALPVAVKRNAYGRQLGSFLARGEFDGMPDVPMTFIRAPAITSILSPDVKVLSTFEDSPTAVRWRNITAFTWHPELTATPYEKNSSTR